jgi:hypothetical protein
LHWMNGMTWLVEGSGTAATSTHFVRLSIATIKYVFPESVVCI